MRLTPNERKEQILKAAINLSGETNYSTITRYGVSKAANCHESLINHYYGTVADLRKAVLKRAIDNLIYPILAQAVIHRDPYLDNISKNVLNRAMESQKL